ncbi:unnamed protein product [Nezara viridula]|uniref:Uncharacterized protein n=1 Tax=Nezara viridula TaxID=85310 RepID=A0A9P0GYU7_NEZVI|nr:unnamed protein product [Nezara viridula]
MGSLIVYLFLSIVALTQGKRVLINEIVDGKLALNNLRAVQEGKTTLNLGAWNLDLVSFEGAVAIGMDSLRRLGFCTMETFNDNSIKYRYFIRHDIHAVYFTKLNSPVPFGEGSGYYRAFTNLISFEYTVNYARKCQVNVDTLTIKTGLELELCVQTTCRNSTADMDLNSFVASYLDPGLNKMLAANTQKVEDSLNKVYCQTNARFDSNDQIEKGQRSPNIHSFLISFILYSTFRLQEPFSRSCKTNFNLVFTIQIHPYQTHII